MKQSNFSDNYIPFRYLRKLLRIGLILTIPVNLFCAVYFIMHGAVDTMLYLTIYCLIFAQLPALLFLVLFFIYKKIKKERVWASVKTDCLLLLFGFITNLILYLISSFID